MNVSHSSQTREKPLALALLLPGFPGALLCGVCAEWLKKVVPFKSVITGLDTVKYDFLANYKEMTHSNLLVYF